MVLVGRSSSGGCIGSARNERYHYSRDDWDHMPGVVQCLAAFILVSFGWMLFLSDFEGSEAIVFHLLAQRNATIAKVALHMWLVLLVSAFACFGMSITKLLDWRPKGRRQAVWQRL